MEKKRVFIISILLIVLLLLFTGCSVRKNVKLKEVKEFSESILESNEKIKRLNFYFIRPYLGANLVYDGDLDQEELQYLIDEFKTLIDVEFMQKIGDEYWGGSRPSEFKIYVYIDTMDNKREGDYDYLISSRYNKTHIHDEEPDNIDGYQTWHIENKDYNEMIISEVEIMKDTVVWNIEWEWLYGELQDRNYRIGKEITDFRDTGDYDTKTHYSNFEVTN